ncbi:MAG: hypothetical protein K6U14_06515 [Firmicutes bacterium]|nr:hypothetical protein [Alicyclobacillaceae bacterium]MCL6497273.1 hypothetical protein [Bacillota bacterium]
MSGESQASEGRHRPRAGAAAEAPVESLNHAIRRELGYLDAVVATPFRVLRRGLKRREGALAEGMEELLWALEGMARLPVKVLQAAFGGEEEVTPR